MRRDHWKRSHRWWQSLAVLLVAAISDFPRPCFAQAPLAQTAYQIGDILLLQNGDFDPNAKNNLVSFTGSGNAIPAQWIRECTLAVRIPLDARTGLVQVRAPGRTGARADIVVAAQPDEIATALNGFFDRLSTNFLDYLVALAALGALTMSVIQAAKALFQLKRSFHSVRVRAWLQKHATTVNQLEDAAQIAKGARTSRDSVSAKTSPDPVAELAKRAEATIVRIAADGNPTALYGMESEDLFRQFSTVLQLAIDFPGSYPDLIRVITSEAPAADVSILLGKTQPSTSQDKTDAVRRVRQQVVQGVVALQLSSEQKWQNIMRIASFVVSFLLAYLALTWSGAGVGSPGGFLITGIIAAFLAPVARDLVAALEKLRG